MTFLCKLACAAVLGVQSRANGNKTFLWGNLEGETLPQIFKSQETGMKQAKSQKRQFNRVIKLPFSFTWRKEIQRSYQDYLISVQGRLILNKFLQYLDPHVMNIFTPSRLYFEIWPQ